MRAFKWSWAVPERSGGVPGGSRARIIDFSLVLEGFGGGGATRGLARAVVGRSGSDPLNSKKTPNTPGTWQWTNTSTRARASTSTRAWARVFGA